MAGTDHSIPTPPGAEDPTAPAVILVGPQLGQNIGATARAMLNCGLTDLRLVRPRDGWPNREAWVTAAGAEEVLERAELFATAAEATADLHRVFATTARRRDLNKPVVTPEEAAREVRELAATHGARCGLLFGPERTGLDTADVVAADAILHIPLNPSYASLNLGQAVLVAAYAWWRAGTDTPARRFEERGDPPARKASVEALLEHLRKELGAAEFWKSESKRPAMWRTITTYLLRGAPTQAEVSLLHGVITALSGRRLDGRQRGEPRPRGRELESTGTRAVGTRVTGARSSGARSSGARSSGGKSEAAKETRGAGRRASGARSARRPAGRAPTKDPRP